MALYHLVGQDFIFSFPISDLEPFASGAKKEDLPLQPFLFRRNELISSAKGWVAGDERMVDVCSSEDRFLIKIANCGEYFATLNGDAIGKSGFQPNTFSQLDREILLGPVIVLALALRGVWSLHSSAAMFQGKTIVFLGESGQGKSTLTAYLSQRDSWRRVADDILPATVDSSAVNVWPRFPQLKLPADAQPWMGLPEHLPLDKICILEFAGIDETPALEQVPPAQAAQIILSHTAGARMFPPDLLARHLDFCVEAAKRVPVYRLTYPHRREALPVVKSLLQDICLSTDS